MPLENSQEGSVLIFSLLMVVLIIAIYYLGINWVNRRKYWFHRKFGPYIVYGEDPRTEMRICWGSKSRYGRQMRTLRDKEFKLGTKKQKLISFKPSESFWDEKKATTISTQSLPKEIIQKCPDLEDVEVSFHHTKFINYVNCRGLKPNTQYFYATPVDKDDTVHKFITVPINPKVKETSSGDPSKNEHEINFEFVAVSDMHASGATIKKTINLIKNKAPNAKFMICMGDNVSDGRIMTHWRTMFGQIEPISADIPFMSIPGNHDGEFKKMAENWEHLFPYAYPNKNEGHYYSFRYLNTAFFGIDLYNAGNQRKIPTETQLEWLRSQLEHLPEEVKFKILYLHNAIYTTGDFGCDPELEEIFLPIIEKYNVQVVINGHSHMFEAFHRTDLNRPHGTYFLTSGGGGARLDYCVLRRFSRTPYKWKTMTHKASENPFLDGDLSDPYRNDDIVINFQQIGKLTYQITHFIVEGDKMTIRCIERNGNVLWKRKLNMDCQIKEIDGKAIKTKKKQIEEKIEEKNNVDLGVMD